MVRENEDSFPTDGHVYRDFLGGLHDASGPAQSTVKELQVRTARMASALRSCATSKSR